MGDLSLCQLVDCRVINRELEFYETAQCLLDGAPGIEMGGRWRNKRLEDGEMDLLAKHPVSNPLWNEYRRSAERITMLQDGHSRTPNFSKRCASTRDPTCFWDKSLVQWEVLFVAVLTNPACPVQFSDLRAWKFADGPSVSVYRLHEPIEIYFESAVDLPIPSEQATQLVQYINRALRDAGVHLPRDLIFERLPAPDLRYHFTLPKGPCGAGERNS